MKRLIVGLATTLLVSGGLGLAGVGAGTAQADSPPFAGGDCPTGQTCSHWCPGDTRQGLEGVQWDWNVCHDWTFSAAGIIDVGSGVVVYAYPNGPIPPAGPPAPPGSPPPPGCPPWATIFSGPAQCGGL